MWPRLSLKIKNRINKIGKKWENQAYPPVLPPLYMRVWILGSKSYFQIIFLEYV